MDKSEFIEFIYRIASHIYDSQSYETDSQQEGAEKEGKPAEVQTNSQIPDHLKELIDEPMHVKFKTVLQEILNIDNQENIWVDSESTEQIQAAADKVGGREHYEMLKFLPPSSRKEYLARI